MIPLRRALPVWTRIAALSFGGPAGQIAVMHRILVDEERWVSEERFLHALRFCTFLPGPEAQQLATYIGWLMHGVPGALLAGLLFILPGFLAILGLSVVYFTAGQLAPVAGLFFGLKAAILSIVVEAVIRIGRRSLRSPAMVAVALASFLGMFAFRIPFPLIVLASALAGLAIRPEAAPESSDTASATLVTDGEAPARPVLARTARTLMRWLLIWWVPIGALALLLGRAHILVQLGLFFSQTALVTFGGAYAVLAYVAQRAVGDFGWLAPGEMVDGLAMAETTPGPLIMVLQFVGFLAAARHLEGVDPILAGVAGSVVTIWATFAPCFLFVLAGAPYAEWLRGRRSLDAALSGIMAAVVGVVLNLAVWFSLHVLFRETVTLAWGPLHLELPALETVDPAALALALLAALATFRLKLGMLTTLGLAGLAGLLWRGVLQP